MKHDLFRLLFRNQYNTLSRALEEGADPNVVQKEIYTHGVPPEATLLMACARFGEIEASQLLLRHGANVNTEDRQGRNALFYAGVSDCPEIVDSLLRRGSRLGREVLCGPVFNRNVRLARKLIKLGASVDAEYQKYPEGPPGWPAGKTILGHTIQGYSAFPASKGMFELLIESGADPNKKSPFFRVTARGKKWIGSVAPTEPIRIAGALGLEDVIKVLFAAGAKGNLRDAMQDCSLERAALRNSIVVARLLLEAGVKLGEPGVESGRYPR